MADKTIGELKRASVPLDRKGKLAFESSQGDAEFCEIGDLEDVAEAAAKEQAEVAKGYAEEGKAYRDAAAESARDAADVALHPPILKDGGDHWWTWSTEANDYVESGADAGVSLTVVEKVIIGEPGTGASVKNLGTDTDANLQFTIEKGEKGDTGDSWVPRVGDDGELTWEKNSEIVPQPVNITGPQGEKGDTGPQGPVGPAGGVNSFNGEQGDIEFPVDPTPTESSQNAVQSGGVWSELQKKPNPNLLINSNFLNPVNRNGKMEYTTSGYTVDMWRTSGNGTIQLTSTGLLLKVGSGKYNNSISQRFSIEYVPEGTLVCFSALVDSKTYSLSCKIPALDSPSFGTGELDNKIYMSIVRNEVDFCTVNIYSYLTEGFNVTAAKLELGSQQTLAHQENGVWVLNEIPSYAEEYAKCIQYSPITGALVGSMYSNPNLLDNWYFADKRLVVNQRNQNIYNITTQAYTIDRWYGTQSGSSISVIDDGLLLTASESDYCVIMSKLVNLGLGGKTVTMSVLLENNELVYQTLDIPVDVHYDSPNMKFNGNSLSSADLIVETDANSTVVFRVFAAPGTTLKIKAVKLELGPVQTLAHKEGDTWVLNEIPDYATELAKCQRYQINLVSASNPEYGFVGVCRLRANNSGSFFVPLPVPLRAMPAVTWKGGFVVNGKTVSSISTDRMTENSVNLMAKTSTTDLVIADIGELWYMSGDNMLLLDANL